MQHSARSSRAGVKSDPRSRQAQGGLASRRELLLLSELGPDPAVASSWTSSWALPPATTSIGPSSAARNELDVGARPFMIPVTSRRTAAGKTVFDDAEDGVVRLQRIIGKLLFGVVVEAQELDRLPSRRRLAMFWVGLIDRCVDAEEAAREGDDPELRDGG